MHSTIIFLLSILISDHEPILPRYSPHQSRSNRAATPNKRRLTGWVRAPRRPPPVFCGKICMDICSVLNLRYFALSAPHPVTQIGLFLVESSSIYLDCVLFPGLSVSLSLIHFSILSRLLQDHKHHTHTDHTDCKIYIQWIKKFNKKRRNGQRGLEKPTFWKENWSSQLLPNPYQILPRPPKRDKYSRFALPCITKRSERSVCNLDRKKKDN